MLDIKNIGVTIGNNDILKNVNFSLNSGNILMVVGPNGSGKTTLIKAIMNDIKHEGEALLYGTDIRNIKPIELAKNIGVLTQKNNIQFAFTCYDLVAIGRYAHKKGFNNNLDKNDVDAIEKAFDITKTSHLKDRVVTNLSGGELQRVCLARTFAQEPKILILDEPTNHLDIEHQIIIFDIIKDWVKEDERAVLSIIHDLNLVYNYGTHCILISKGKQVSFGTPKDVLTKDNLKTVYNIDLVSWMQSMLEKWQ